MLYRDELIVGETASNEAVSFRPQMIPCHGLVAGAARTGTEGTVQMLAEACSDLGVPVFLPDHNLFSGLAVPGQSPPALPSQEAVPPSLFQESGFSYHGYPVVPWDLYGQEGIPLRTTISEMGPLLLAHVLGLTELQRDLLVAIFKLADDQGLLLIDTKDLKALLHYVETHGEALALDYGKISSASLGAITRSLVALYAAGGDRYFGQPALGVTVWLAWGDGGRGQIHLLEATRLQQHPGLYTGLLLWLLAELGEQLPSVGQVVKPKLVFFVPQAHLLFQEGAKALGEKLPHLLQQLTDRGVGVFLCTSLPSAIPDSLLPQLGLRIQHSLQAYTPTQLREAKKVADSLRSNPAFDTLEALQALQEGEALISFWEDSQIPSMVQVAKIAPLQSQPGSMDPTLRQSLMVESLLYSRYATPVDPNSAYERLLRRSLEEPGAEKPLAVTSSSSELAAASPEGQGEGSLVPAQEQGVQALTEAEKKAADKAQAQKEKTAAQNRKKLVNTVSGTVGREIGKTVGKSIGGDFGKTLGGNVGAQLARNVFGTLLGK